MKFRMKVYRVKGEVLVAVCDEEIVGKSFSEGDLRIQISEEFYGKESYDENEVRRVLKQATIANISGERAVRIAIEMGIVDENKILRIGECWHAQMVVM